MHIRDLGCFAQGLGFRVPAAGVRVLGVQGDSSMPIRDLGCFAQGLGFRALAAGSRVLGF